MSQQNHINIKELINKHNRRLQKLKEQKALKGINAAPELLIEIEDIEVEIEKLQIELEEAKFDHPTDSISRRAVQQKGVSGLSPSHFDMLRLLYASYREGIDENTQIEEVAEELRLPPQKVRTELSYLSTKDYVELSASSLGIRIYEYAKITPQGIYLVENTDA